MAGSLDGVRLKLERAEEHLNTLESEASGFFSTFEDHMG